MQPAALAAGTIIEPQQRYAPDGCGGFQLDFKIASAGQRHLRRPMMDQAAAACDFGFEEGLGRTGLGCTGTQRSSPPRAGYHAASDRFGQHLNAGTETRGTQHHYHRGRPRCRAQEANNGRFSLHAATWVTIAPRRWTGLRA